MTNFFNFAGQKDHTDQLANQKEHFIEIYHPLTEDYIRFKAMLLEFSDDYQPSWNDEEVFGRMDDISTFKRTKRVISIKLDVIAGSAEEAIFNHQSLSKLASWHYPAYEDQNGGASSMIGAPLLKVKFLNLIHDVNAVGSDASTAGLLIKTKGCRYSPNQEAGFFDILYNGISSIFAKHYQLSLEMDVYHQHKLGYTKTGDPRSRVFKQFPYSGFGADVRSLEEETRLEEQETLAEIIIKASQEKKMLR